MTMVQCQLNTRVRTFFLISVNAHDLVDGREGGGGGSGWKKGIGSSSLAALLVIDGGLECPILNAELTLKNKIKIPPIKRWFQPKFQG